MATTFRAGYGGDTAGYGEHNPGAGLQSPSETLIWITATFRCMELLLRVMDIFEPVKNRIISFLLQKLMAFLVEAIGHLHQ